MSTIQYALQGGLSTQQLQQIHQQVLKVLDQIGVECRHEGALQRLAGRPGLKVHDHRVTFRPDLVEAFIENLRRAPERAKDEDRIVVTGPWNCFNIEDMDSRRVRASTAADVREMFKLVHAAKAGPICPVYPTDIKGPLQLLYLEKAGIELADSSGSGMEFSDRQMLEFAIQMHRAAGRKYEMVVQFPISPLRLNPSGLQTILDYMDRTDVEVNPAAAPIPQAGLTAPLIAPGPLVQSVAESFASCLVIEALTGRRHPHANWRVDLFDMRYMTTTFASPQHILYQLLLNDVCRHFTGRPMRSHYWCCNAKRCDQQAMLERVSWLLTLALAGYRRFGLGAGQLSMDEVFSPAQFVIDYEIARYVTDIIRGLPYEDSPDFAFDTIRQASPDGDFLTHPTTLQAMGQAFYSDLFPRTKVDQWRAAGEPDIWSTAVERARALIASHHHAIAPSVQQDLDRIYAEATRYASQRPAK